MKTVLYAAMVSLIVSLVGTPFVIRAFRRLGFGQRLREDWGDIGHHEQKRGTPTMGGVMIILAVVAGYVFVHITREIQGWAGVHVVWVMIGMGTVGFLDDYLKISRRRSLGLNKTMKLAGQGIVAVLFAIVVNRNTDAPTALSFIRPALAIGLPFFIIWVFIMMSSATNGVNLTDGLDGLAAGSSAFVFAAFIFITFWQFRHPCHTSVLPIAKGCYTHIPNALDLAVVASSGLGACAGFLWWNAAPARIFMGDTGSLALGGAIAALSILTSTQLLLIVLGGLFVLETTSVILQVISFRGFHTRVFRMAPLHHHFELGGWPEFTVIVRFWIIAGLAAALGLGLFYSEFLQKGGIG